MANEQKIPTGYDIVDTEDVQVQPRGRKVELNDELLTALRNIPAGKAMVLRPLGKIPQDKRATVSQRIRKHWTAAHGVDSKCRIDYTTDGIPQVRHRN